MSPWVNFKKLRESLDFAEVLEDYGVELTVKGDQATGFCPLPGHKSRSKRKSRSFSVNLKKGIFQCFGCQAKGNVLDFAALMEGLDPKDPGEFRRAAVMLHGRYLSGESAAEKRAEEVEADSADDSKNGLERVVNAPLGFELKNLESDHPYLEERGLTKETVQHFGLGYCRKGLMKGRVVIPLHDQDGVLIGYAGRWVDDDSVSEENPKYKLPGTRERNGKQYEFRKSEFLFNGHRIDGPVEDLIVVEGFFGAMWLHQAGYTEVVALMGASCSERQAEQLVELVSPNGHLWVMPDGDEGGEKCAHAVLAAVAPHRFVRWVKLEEGQQPEDCSPEMLTSMFGEPHG